MRRLHPSVHKPATHTPGTGELLQRGLRGLRPDARFERFGRRGGKPRQRSWRNSPYPGAEGTAGFSMWDPAEAGSYASARSWARRSKGRAEQARSGDGQEQGLRVFQGSLDEYIAQARNRPQFDIITANHVVEHLAEPVESLRMMKGLLAPGGFIWISVPNGAYPLCRALKGRWHSSDLPYHLMQFSPASMTKAGHQARAGSPASRPPNPYPESSPDP